MRLITLFCLAPVAFALIIPARHCDVSAIQVPLLTGLSIPDGEKTEFITLGRGVQNYTCTGGVYVSAGAVANLYDVSCMMTLLQPFVAADQTGTSLTSSAVRILGYPDSSRLPVKLDHFFTTVSSGIAPVFRYPSTGEEVVGAVAAKVASPKEPSVNIPWLQLKASAGSLSKSVYRTNTVKGQPPASCNTEGEKLSVDYSAMYYFTK